jgi:Ca-activated chloride channel homolog
MTRPLHEQAPPSILRPSILRRGPRVALATPRPGRKPFRTGLLLVMAALWLPAMTAFPTPLAAAADEDTGGRLLLVLDSSGSMKEPDSSGTTKIAAAKRALRDVVADVPAGAPVGMRVYGATVFDRSDPAACTDSQLVVPVGPVDKPELRRQIGWYRPYGETPIAHALLEAAQDLGDTGKGTILLVSDGEETCHPDPCAVAREIREKGVELKVDVVGMSVPERARRQLQCIADAGGGTYCQTETGGELDACLGRSSLRAFREFAVSGTPVRGAATSAAAPEIAPGRYADILGGDEEPTGLKYYRVPKPPGATLHVAVTARTTSPEQSDGIDLALLNPAGDECSSGGVSTLSEYQGNPVINDTVIFRPDESDTYDCASEEALVLEVRRGDEIQDRAPDSGGLPVEIVVESEPRVTNVAALPPQFDEAAIDERLPASGPAGGRVSGGSTFAAAPRIRPGSWSDTLQSGEMLFYRVRADWGEAPRFALRMLPDPALEEKIDVPGTPVTIFAYAPDRTPISLTGSEHGSSGSYLGNEEVVLAANLPPVRYRNRLHYSFDTTRIGPTSLAGDYYFAVHLQDELGAPRYQVQTHITVAVDGSRSGVPAYAQTAEATQPASAAPDTGRADRKDRPARRRNTPVGATDGAGVLRLPVVAFVAAAVIATGALTAFLVLWTRDRRIR